MNRYNRNILVDGFGESGQEKLLASKVLVIGAGGLGSVVLYYLAAAGVGTLGIMDPDIVDTSNLQRQIIHQTQDLGKKKVDSASEKIKALNPDIRIITYPELFSESNKERIKDYDFIIECCDNYTAKFLINDVCVALQKPYSHGAVLAMQGEAMTYTPGNACYRSVFNEPPQNGTTPVSSEAGIIGSIAGIIGSIQATEAIKYLTGIGELLINRILLLDGITMRFQTLTVNK